MPNVLQAALGLYEFKYPNNKIISYTAEVAEINTTSAIINMSPVGDDAAIIYLSFSVLIITNNNNYSELITLSKTGLTQSNSSSTEYLYGNSSKFSSLNSEAY